MATIAFNAIRTIWSAGRAVTFLPRQVLLPECAFFLPALPSPSPSSTSTFSTSSSKRSDNPPKIENLEDLENLLNVPRYRNRDDEFFNALKLEIEGLKEVYSEARRRALYAERIGGKDKVPEILCGENGRSLLGPAMGILRFYSAHEH